MLKRKLGLVLVLASVFLIWGCKNPVMGGVLKENVTVGDEGLADKDLAGKTVTVTAGTTLSNLKGGFVDIDAGSGTVRINGGSDLSVTVKSNANLILDANTHLKSLIITNAAKKATVESTKSIEVRAARAAGREAEPADGTGEPSIDNLQVDTEADVVLDGGNVTEAVLCSDSDKEADIIISKDSTAVVKDLVYADKEGTVDKTKNLVVTVDDAYDGDGIKLNIDKSTMRADALVREVLRIKKVKTDDYEYDEWMGIEWVEAAAWNPDKQKVFDSSFTYEFLQQDRNYEIVIRYYKPVYIDGNGNYSDEKLLISSTSVPVTPKKGVEFTVRLNGTTMKVTDGVIKWETDDGYPTMPLVDRQRK